MARRKHISSLALSFTKDYREVSDIKSASLFINEFAKALEAEKEQKINMDSFGKQRAKGKESECWIGLKNLSEEPWYEYLGNCDADNDYSSELASAIKNNVNSLMELYKKPYEAAKEFSQNDTKVIQSKFLKYYNACVDAIKNFSNAKNDADEKLSALKKIRNCCNEYLNKTKKYTSTTATLIFWKFKLFEQTFKSFYGRAEFISVVRDGINYIIKNKLYKTKE